MSELTLLLDNEKPASYGENFVGHKYCAEEIFAGIVESYLGNDQSVTWVEVPDKLNDLKNSFTHTALTVNGRDIPSKLIHSGNIMGLIGVTKDGTSFYTNIDGQFAMVAPEGRIVTDIEAFFDSGIYSSIEDEVFVYSTELLEQYAQYNELELKTA